MEEKISTSLRSSDEDDYMVSVSLRGELEILHGDMSVTRRQLAGQWVSKGNILARCFFDGVPCVVVATYGKGSGVYIHHAFSGELMRSLPFREDVLRVCLGRRGTLVVFGTKSGLVVCWDLTTGATVEHKCYDNSVDALCFSGDHVVTVSFTEGSAHMWSLPSFEAVSQCTVRSPLVAAAYGSNVFFGANEAVTEWDIATGAVSELVDHSGSFPAEETRWVFAVDISADGRVLVSADEDGLIVATDLTTKTMLWSKSAQDTIFAISIHNNAVFVPGKYSRLRVLDLATGDFLREYSHLAGETRGIAVFSAPQHKVAMREAAQDIDAGTIAVWNEP